MDYFEKHSHFYDDSAMPKWYSELIYVTFLGVICSYCYLLTEKENKFDDFAERINHLKIILT
jgi:hypothetical protein